MRHMFSFLLFFCWATLAQAQVDVHDTASTQTATGGSSVTISSMTVTSGASVMIAGVTTYVTSTSAVTWNGGAESFTKIDEAVYSTLGLTDLWCLDNPTVTTDDVVVTNAATGVKIAYAYTLEGSDTCANFGTPGKDQQVQALGETNSVGITDSVANGLVIDVLGQQAGAPTPGATKGGSQTLITGMDTTHNNGSAWVHLHGSVQAGGSGTKTMSWTNDDVTANIVTLIAVAVPPASATRRILHTTIQ